MHIVPNSLALTAPRQAQPSLLLNFATDGAAAVSRLTYTGANGTYVNSAGLVTAATTGVPRLTYDPVTLAPLGLLVEEARDNNLLNSQLDQNFGGRGTKPPTVTNSVVFNSESCTRGVFGTDSQYQYSGSRMDGNASGVVQSYAGCQSGNTYTMSMYVALSRALAANEAISVWATGGWGWDTDYNIYSGNCAGFVNKLKRVSYSTVAPALGYQYPILNWNGDPNPSSPITVYVCKGAVELGAFATSYISSDHNSRSADVCTRTLGAEFNATAGTIVVDAYWPSVVSGNNCIASITDGTTANRLDIYQNNGTAYALARVSGTDQVTLNLGTATASARAKIAFAYQNGSYAACLNGGTVQTSAYAGVPSGLTTLSLGSSNAASNWLNSTIAAESLYAQRLPNTMLQALTT